MCTQKRKHTARRLRESLFPISLPAGACYLRRRGLPLDKFQNSNIPKPLKWNPIKMANGLERAFTISNNPYWFIIICKLYQKQYPLIIFNIYGNHIRMLIHFYLSFASTNMTKLSFIRSIYLSVCLFLQFFLVISFNH